MKLMKFVEDCLLRLIGDLYCKIISAYATKPFFSKFIIVVFCLMLSGAVLGLNLRDLVQKNVVKLDRGFGR